MDFFKSKININLNKIRLKTDIKETRARAYRDRAIMRESVFIKKIISKLLDVNYLNII